MRISVMYVIDTLEVGGTERSLLEIVRRLRNVDATVCHVYPGDALRRDYEEHGVRVIPLNIRGKYAPFRTVAALRRLVRELEPDIVHSMLFRASLFSRLASIGTGVVHVGSLVSDSYGARRYDRLGGLDRWKLTAIRWADRITVPLVRHFIANSASVASSNCAALRIPESKVKVIHRGRKGDDFLVGERETIDVRDKLLAGGTSVILNVARLRGLKGQSELVRSVPAVGRGAPGARIVIAGEGPFRGALEALIGRLGVQDSVRLLGHREDVPVLLSAADVFVFPSHFEGHPGAVLEAMFAGKPIVASDTPEHRETVEHGRTALLVPAGDADRLADAIVWMLKHPDEANEMGTRARRVAWERFTIEEAARRHEDLYRELWESMGRPRCESCS
jgi:glycosyltransferase involved in cell wall biosynthesis